MWTERAPQETVDRHLFPRILALAEVLWNDPQNKNYDEFYARLQNTYEDLAALGIQFGRESKIIVPSTIYDSSKKEFSVSIAQGQKDIEVRYTTDGNDPDMNSQLYKEPINLSASNIYCRLIFTKHLMQESN